MTEINSMSLSELQAVKEQLTQEIRGSSRQNAGDCKLFARLRDVMRCIRKLQTDPGQCLTAKGYQLRPMSTSVYFRPINGTGNQETATTTTPMNGGSAVGPDSENSLPTGGTVSQSTDVTVKVASATTPPSRQETLQTSPAVTGTGSSSSIQESDQQSPQPGGNPSSTNSLRDGSTGTALEGSQTAPIENSMTATSGSTGTPTTSQTSTGEVNTGGRCTNTKLLVVAATLLALGILGYYGYQSNWHIGVQQRAGSLMGRVRALVGR